MTEGGGSCVLVAHEFPDKVDTVGKPGEGHDIRLIDENGVEVGPGEIGEIVGHSGAIMNGYHNQPGKTRGGAMGRAGRARLHPHRRRRPVRRGRLSEADGPPQGHDHFRRLQHLSERSGSDPRDASRGAGMRGRRHQVGRMGRDAAGLRGPAAGRLRRRRTSCANSPMRSSARRSACRRSRSSTRCRAARSARS